MAAVKTASYDPPGKGNSNEVDLNAHPTAKKLVDRCEEFFAEMQNLTPGKALEEWLNTNHGPGTPFYDDFSKYILQGLSEGWVATEPISGAEYRRSRICAPSAATRYFSITAVFMESPGERGSDQELLGQYHKHPYGEINCVILLNPEARLMGMQGWQGNGWTSPGPGTHHYPQAKGGALISLFFLPAGRIAYDATPGTPQPLSV